jgi:hypothetical protein
MMSLNILPFEGALPIRFGMHRDLVRGIFGVPKSSNEMIDSWGSNLTINVGYDADGAVSQLGLGPGEFELTICGEFLWSPERHPDPNPVFLRLDAEPLERVGFLFFPKIGIGTTGYHDDDDSQLAISVYPRGALDKLLVKAKKPVLTKYK